MPLYFVAIIPPADIKNEIVAFQKEIEKKYAAIHAQNAPPHITIIPPFNCSEEKLIAFKTKLITFLIKELFPKIKIELKGFQRFDYRTLFVDVSKNTALLQKCKELKLLFKQQKIIKQRQEKHFFVPHVTIANKDIKKPKFKLAWQKFKDKSYCRKFDWNEIVILKHSAKKWEVIEQIEIKQSIH